MISTLLLTVALAQATAPVLPAGVDPIFQAEVLAIERLLEKSEFDAASERLARLPTRELTITWDDANIPVEKRQDFAAARQMAFSTWQRVVPDLTFKLADAGQLKVDFAPRPATPPPAPKTLEPNATIYLERGDPSKPLDAVNLHNEVARAIGKRLGVADSIFASNAMLPSDHVSAMRFMIMPQDGAAANANLKALEFLRQAAANKQTVKPAAASISFDTKAINLGKVLQGERKQFQIAVHNKGTAPLQLLVRPDCGCMTTKASHAVAPGATLTIPVQFDSTPFPSPIDKKVIFVTNDELQTTHIVDMTADISPMYRFLVPAGNVAVLNETGGKAEIYLTFTERDPFILKRIDFNGIPGQVQYEPWEGTLPDPELGTGPIKRRGYKFTVTLSPGIPPGRSPGTLQLITDSDDMPMVSHTIYAQKGIIALPDELYLGDMAEAKTSKLLVTRPGKDFKVTGVSSNSPYLKAAISPGKNGQEYVLEIAYDGNAPKGEFASHIEVKTDDARQPVIQVRVIGTVR